MRQSLAPYRLRSQRLVGPGLPDPVAVVRHLGAVQSQEHTTAPWSIGRRCGATLTQVLDALDVGRVVRTHVLRTTWHHVHLDDLPLVMAATGDRVMAQVVPHVRRQGVDEATLVASSEVVSAAVRETPGCTRDVIADRLAAAGLPARGDVLAHVVMAAELRGEIAGRRDPGTQHRYHPVVLTPSPLDAQAARAWLAATYVRGHGPAGAADLAWWSSLTLTQARRALVDAGLHEVQVAGRSLWTDVDAGTLESERVDVPPVLLLANFDELISHARDGDLRAEVGPRYDDVLGGVGILVLDGRLAGSWNRSVSAGRLDVTVRTDASLSPRHRSALDEEAQALATFSGLAETRVAVS